MLLWTLFILGNKSDCNRVQNMFHCYIEQSELTNIAVIYEQTLVRAQSLFEGVCVSKSSFAFLATKRPSLTFKNSA